MPTANTFTITIPDFPQTWPGMNCDPEQVTSLESEELIERCVTEIRRVMLLAMRQDFGHGVPFPALQHTISSKAHR
jgi:hypothetical protein